MLNLGFEPELRRLVTHRRMPGPPARQTLLLSATMPEGLRGLAAEFLHHHVALDVGTQVWRGVCGRGGSTRCNAGGG
eukprot:351400-Chlamydomonas_euryale.AAC.2